MFRDSLLAFVVVVVVGGRIQKSLLLFMNTVVCWKCVWLPSRSVHMFLLSAWNVATEWNENILDVLGEILLKLNMC